MESTSDSDSSNSSWVFIEPPANNEDAAETKLEEDSIQKKFYLNCEREPIQELTLDSLHSENESESDGISVITDSEENISASEECTLLGEDTCCEALKTSEDTTPSDEILEEEKEDSQKEKEKIQPKPRSIYNMLIAYAAVVAVAFLLGQIFKETSISDGENRKTSHDSSVYVLENDTDIKPDKRAVRKDNQRDYVHRSFGYDDYEEFQNEVINPEHEKSHLMNDDYENFIDFDKDDFFDFEKPETKTEKTNKHSYNFIKKDKNEFKKQYKRRNSEERQQKQRYIKKSKKVFEEKFNTKKRKLDTEMKETIDTLLIDDGIVENNYKKSQDKTFEKKYKNDKYNKKNKEKYLSEKNNEMKKKHQKSRKNNQDYVGKQKNKDWGEKQHFNGDLHEKGKEKFKPYKNKQHKDYEHLNSKDFNNKKERNDNKHYVKPEKSKNNDNNFKQTNNNNFKENHRVKHGNGKKFKENNEETSKLKAQEIYLNKKEKYLLKKEYKLFKKEMRINMMKNSLKYKKPKYPNYIGKDQNKIRIETLTIQKQPNKTISGEWYLNLHTARNKIRKEEHESDWLFNRANMRSRRRNKGY